MKKWFLYSFLFALTISSVKCSSNWLDVVPENDIETIETNFEKKEDAEAWLKTCYVFLIEDCVYWRWFTNGSKSLW